MCNTGIPNIGRLQGQVGKIDSLTTLYSIACVYSRGLAFLYLHETELRWRSVMEVINWSLTGLSNDVIIRYANINSIVKKSGYSFQTRRLRRETGNS